jgi:hypothetical protein
LSLIDFRTSLAVFMNTPFGLRDCFQDSGALQVLIASEPGSSLFF